MRYNILCLKHPKQEDEELLLKKIQCKKGSFKVLINRYRNSPVRVLKTLALAKTSQVILKSTIENSRRY